MDHTLLHISGVTYRGSSNLVDLVFFFLQLFQHPRVRGPSRPFQQGDPACVVVIPILTVTHPVLHSNRHTHTQRETQDKHHDNRLHPPPPPQSLALPPPDPPPRPAHPQPLPQRPAQVPRPFSRLTNRLVALLGRLPPTPGVVPHRAAPKVWPCCPVGAEYAVVCGPGGVEGCVWVE